MIIWPKLLLTSMIYYQGYENVEQDLSNQNKLNCYDCTNFRRVKVCQKAKRLVNCGNRR